VYLYNNEGKKYGRNNLGLEMFKSYVKERYNEDCEIGAIILRKNN